MKTWKKSEIKREWLKRYYLDEETVTLWKYPTLYQVESCINGVEVVSTTLDYNDAIKIFDRQRGEVSEK